MTKALLCAAEQVHQPALAERPGQTDGKSVRLQPLVGQGLEGFEVRRHRMKPRAKRRAPRCLGLWSNHPRPAARATYREPAVLPHDRRHLR